MKTPEFQSTVKEFSKYGYSDQDWIYAWWKKQEWTQIFHYEQYVAKVAQDRVKKQVEQQIEKQAEKRTQLNLTADIQMKLSAMSTEERKKYIEDYIIKK